MTRYKRGYCILRYPHFHLYADAVWFEGRYVSGLEMMQNLSLVTAYQNVMRRHG